MRTTTICTGLAAILLLTGCSSLKKSIDNINRENSATGSLESFIQGELATKFHRDVRSVSCTPYVDEVVTDSNATMTCVVRFTDGSSYTTPGTVTNPSTDPDYAYYTYSFNDPPAVDITTAPLPQPTVLLSASSPESLFVQANLAPVVKKLTTRFGASDLIIQLALYPGELVAVIADSNNQAYLVTATHSGTLTVGPATDFDGSRYGIDFSQLSAAVIEQLTKAIASGSGVPVTAISRFVLTNSLPDQDSGWNIYLTSGTTRFQSRVLGDHLVEITPNGTHALT
jgi:hypothetical protein